MPGFISSWVSRLRGHRPDPGLQHDQAGLVRVVADADGLLGLGSTLREPPLFRVRATLAARLEEKAEEDGVVRVQVPLDSSAFLRVRVQASGTETGPADEPEADLETGAGTGKEPETATGPATRPPPTPAPGAEIGPAPQGAADEVFVVCSRLERRREARILEFCLEAGDRQVLYRFEVDPALEVLDVTPAQALPSLFPEIPPAAEMAEFLRRIADERRGAPQVLASLLRYTSTSTARRARALLESWPAPQAAQPLVGALERFCRSRGRRVNRDSLEAFCRLVELEREGHGEPEPGVALAVADILGLVLDEEAWTAEFAAFGSYAGACQVSAEPAVAALVARLRDPHRSPLDILEDLGRDAGSRRVSSAVRRLRVRLPGGLLQVNDEQLALLPLLQASGRPVHPGTVLALCLFVDLETGSLDVEALDAACAPDPALETSMYAMVAVAGAFGLRLEAFAMEGEPARPEDEMLGRLAGQAEGGLLVCFRRHAEAGRRWEWIRDREGLLRIEQQGLDFSGLLLGYLPGGWGDAPLLPVEPRRLRDRGEVLSRQQLAMRQIQAALRRLGGAGSDMVLMGREPQVLEAACEWLRSGGAAGLLDPLVGGETRRQMVQALHRGGLEVRADRGLVQAASAGGPVQELLALLLLQELSASPLLKLEGAFKDCDERALRSLLLERTSNLLTSEDPSIRALATRLLAARDLAADRASRLGSEYPLGMARADQDSAVEAAAVEALTRLALSEVTPLPAAVELVPCQGRVLPDGLAEVEVQAALGQLGEWHSKVAREDPGRLATLPFRAAEGALDIGAARPLAQVLAAIHQACRQDGTLSAPRWLALVPRAELTAGARALLDSWRQLARQLGRSLVDLDPQECGLDHRLMVEDQASRLLQRWGGLPFLGGPGRALTLHRVAPGRLAGPWTTYEKYRGVVVTEEAPFFRALLEHFVRAAAPGVCVVRLTASRTPSGEGPSERQQARVDTVVEFREVEVLDPQVPEFCPLLRWLERMQVEPGLEVEDLQEFRGALALAAGNRPPAEKAEKAEKATPVGDAENVEVASPALEPPAARDPEALSRAAAALARQFELEGGQEHLLGLLRRFLG